MENNNGWSLDRDAKKGDILVLDGDENKWIFRFECATEYPGHYVHGDMLIESKSDGVPMLQSTGKGVSYIEETDKVRPADDGEKRLFYQSFGNVDMSELQEIRTWIGETESCFRDKARVLKRFYDRGYADAMRDVGAKLDTIIGTKY